MHRCNWNCNHSKWFITNQNDLIQGCFFSCDLWLSCLLETNYISKQSFVVHACNFENTIWLVNNCLWHFRCRCFPPFFRWRSYRISSSQREKIIQYAATITILIPNSSPNAHMNCAATAIIHKRKRHTNCQAKKGDRIIEEESVTVIAYDSDDLR